MVVTRLDKKKPIQEQPITPSLPVEQTQVNTTAPITNQVVSQAPVGTTPITPVETPKIEPITAVNPNIDTTQTPVETPQVTTKFGGNEPVRPFGVNTEKTTTTTPEGTTTVVKEQPKQETPITTISQFKQAGGTIDKLDELVASRPEFAGIMTNIEGNKLVGVMPDGRKFEWTIDQAGNPIRKDMPASQADLTRNNLLNKYMTANADVLYNAMINGDISPEMEQGLTANPNFAIAKEKQRKQQSVNNTNSQIEGMYNNITGKTKEETDVIQDMSNKIIAGKGDKTEEDLLDYSNFLGQDEELKTAVTDLNGKVQLKRETERVIKDRMDELTQQYPGLTKGALMVLSARQNKDLYNQLDYLNDDIMTLQSTVAYKEKILDKEYDTKVKAQQTAEQRAYEQGLTQDERAYNEQLQTKQLEQQYQYQYGDLESTNPTLKNIAIERAVADMYEKYPLPGMESQATKVQKVKELMDQGMTGSQAIASLEQEIRGTQRYKDYISGITPLQREQLALDRAKLNQTTPTSTPTTTQPTGVYDEFQIGNKTIKMDSSASGSFQAAMAEMPASTVIGSQQFRTAEEQAKLVKEGKSWTMNSNHMKGLAVDIYADSKMSPPTQEQIAIMNKNGWYQDPALIAKGDAGHFDFKGVQGPQVSSDAQNYFNLIQKGTTSYDEVFKKLGGSKVGQALMNEINALISEKGGVIPALPNSPQVKTIQTSIDKLQNLVNNPDRVENLSGFFQTSPLDAMTGKNADTRADIEFILNEKVLQNLIDAKANGATFGALSNDELNLLKNSSSALSAMVKKDADGNITGFKGSEKKVKAEIKSLLDLYKEKKEKMLNPGLSSDTTTGNTGNTVTSKNGNTYTY